MKFDGIGQLVDGFESPLMRGEWIEISDFDLQRSVRSRSPLMRGEWIEIDSRVKNAVLVRSPLMRGEWIEMSCAS